MPIFLDLHELPLVDLRVAQRHQVVEARAGVVLLQGGRRRRDQVAASQRRAPLARGHRNLAQRVQQLLAKVLGTEATRPLWRGPSESQGEIRDEATAQAVTR